MDDPDLKLLIGVVVASVLVYLALTTVPSANAERWLHHAWWRYDLWHLTIVPLAAWAITAWAARVWSRADLTVWTSRDADPSRG